jgi:hypothetical protein
VNTLTTWAFSADMEINQMGSTCGAVGCTDLVAYIPGVKDSVCDAVNELAGISDPTARPSQNDGSFGPFQGAYTYVDTMGDQAGTAKLSAKSAGCFESVADGVFVVYKVLLAR